MSNIFGSTGYDKPNKDKLREDVFNEHYTEFQRTKLYQELADRYEEKPYYKENRRLMGLSRFSSYFFNVLSVGTASSFVFFFLNPFIGNWIVSVIITLLLIAMAELFKRFTATKWFRNVVQHKKYALSLGIISIFFALLSATCSFYGGKQIVAKLRKSPTYIHTESFTKKFDVQIAQIEKEIEAARKTTYRGNTTTHSQSTIDKLTEQRQIILERKYKVEDDTRNENRIVLDEHRAETQIQAQYFAYFALGCEVFFLLSIWYIEYYGYRSFREFESIKVETQKGEEDNLKQHTIFVKNIVIDEFGKVLQTSVQKAIDQVKEETKLLEAKRPKQIAAPKTTNTKPTASPSKADITSQPDNVRKEVNPKQEGRNLTVINSDNGNINDNNRKSSNMTKTDKNYTAEQEEEIENLKASISKLRSKIHTSEYRIKKKIGKKETQERNIETATQELEQLIRRLDAIKNRAA